MRDSQRRIPDQLGTSSASVHVVSFSDLKRAERAYSDEGAASLQALASGCASQKDVDRGGASHCNGHKARRLSVRKTFMLDPEAIACLDEICQARNCYSDLMKSSFTHNQSQAVRDAINLLYRFEVGKESLVHDEDPRYM
ncbi:hypothetical protein [Eggerthella lenta]|uniref:hypothetical protein n=1 Tax=Eggerthella lenta TaxID=84112 RepID=UPI0011C02766|nr:hypothetical protein [Eggerthella lenta]